MYQKVVTISLLGLPVLALWFVFRGLLVGQLFYNNDVLLQVLPYLYERAHSSVVVTQAFLSGFPLYVSTNAAWFSPGALVSTYLSAPVAYALLTLLYMILAYGCTYLYARKIGLSLVPAVVAATTFVFSGQVLLWSASLINSSYYFLLPLVLYLFERALERKNLRWRLLWAVAIGLLLGLGWLSSHVQFVVYIHALFAAYGLYRVWQRGEARVSAALYLVSPLLISLLAGLPMILSVLGFQPETIRSDGVPLASAIGNGYMPWDFIHYLLPFWQVSVGISVSSPNLYLGILPLLLLGIALSRLRELTHPLRWFYVVVLGFCLFAALRYSPLGLLLHYLPLWSAFREAPRIMFVGGFAAAMLAGMGAQWVLQQPNAVWGMPVVQWFRRLFLYIALPGIVVMTLVRGWFFEYFATRLDSYFFTHIYQSTTRLPPEHYQSVIRTYLHQVLDQVSLYDPQVIFFVLFSILSLTLLFFAARISKQMFGACVVVLIVLNMVFVYGGYHRMVSTDVVLSVPSTVERIRAHQHSMGGSEPFRVYSVLPAQAIYRTSVTCPMSSEETVRLQNALLQANSTFFFSLDSVEGYENYMPKLVSDALNYIGSENTLSESPLFLADMTLAEKHTLIASRANMLRAMNVRYVVSTMPLQHQAYRLLDTWREGVCKTSIYLYELEGVWPRYFTTTHWKVATTTGTHALQEIAAHATPTVLFAEHPPKLPLTTNNKTEAVSPVISDNTITFKRLSCEADCILFIGNAYMRGWEAFVDGVPSPLHRVQYLYMGVLLSAGEHTVKLRYTKPLW